MTFKYDLKKKELSVCFRSSQVSLRALIEKIKVITKGEVIYKHSSNKGDIRSILSEETSKYLKRFLVSLAALVPILALMWIVPFAKP